MNLGAAFITGSANRIGKAMALSLAEKGWNIAIHYNSSQVAAKELEEEIKAMGQKAIILKADLADKIEAKKLFKEARVKLGKPINLLINNASLFEDDNIKTINKKSFQDHIDINLWAPILLSKIFTKDSDTGNIINIIDQRVLNPKAGFLSYTMAKSTLLTFTKILAQEVAPSFRVNAICPGPVLQSIHQSEADFKLEVGSLLLKIAPTVEDINRAISFILATPSLTGEIITLDGGQHLQ